MHIYYWLSIQTNSSYFFILQLDGRYVGLYLTPLLLTFVRKVNFKKCHLLVYGVICYSGLVWFWRSEKGIFSPLLFYQRANKSQNLCSSKILALETNHNLCFYHFALNQEVLRAWLGPLRLCRQAIFVLADVLSRR